MGITVKSVTTNVSRKQAFTDAAVSVENYKEKYAGKIPLHPVFWSEEMHDYCSDVRGDEDHLWTYNLKYITVVTNKEKHPELCNH